MTAFFTFQFYANELHSEAAWLIITSWFGIQ